MEDTKQQIIQAALKIMSEKGIDGITTRKIARDAKVNVAAVNYYFHSKDKLIEESIGSFVAKLEDIFLTLEKNEKPRDLLMNFLEKFIDYVAAHPGITKSLFFQMISPVRLNTRLAASMKKNFGLLKNNIRQNTNLKEDKILNFMALELISAVVYPILLSRHLKEVSLIDYSDSNDRKKYVDLLINKLI